MTPILPALQPQEDALFLDFDGTLVPIAPRPDAVEVPPGLEPLLGQLHGLSQGAVALVSGRALAELRAFLPGFAGALAGSHGAELAAEGLAACPDATAAAAAAQPGLDQLHRATAAFAAQHGLLAEAKPHGVALHFRAKPQAEPLALAFIREAGARHGLAVQPAKMAYELRPAHARKDGALARLMDLPAFRGRRPVYLGDDTTDEPALAWAEARGGYGIKIGPGETQARHRLAGPEQVLAWLAGAPGLKAAPRPGPGAPRAAQTPAMGVAQ